MHLNATAIVNLQSYSTLSGANLGIGDVDHGLAVEPRLDTVANDTQAESVPLAFADDVFFLVGNLHEPTTAIRFVDTGSVVPFGSHFTLPAMHLHRRLDERAEEHARIAVGKLLEFESKVEIVIVFASSEVSILLVGATFAHQISLGIDIPFSVP